MLQETLITKPLAIGQVLMASGFLMVGISQKPDVEIGPWLKVVAILGFCLVITSMIVVRRNPRFSFVAFSVIGFSLIYMSNWIHSHVLPSIDKVWRHAVLALYVVGMPVMVLSVIKTASKLYSIARSAKGSLG